MPRSGTLKRRKCVWGTYDLSSRGARSATWRSHGQDPASPELSRKGFAGPSGLLHNPEEQETAFLVAAPPGYSTRFARDYLFMGGISEIFTKGGT